MGQVQKAHEGDPVGGYLSPRRKAFDAA